MHSTPYWRWLLSQVRTLYDKYGYCIIPVGTKLYKANSSTDFETCMFFGLQKWIARAFQNDSDKIQIWTVKRDIKVLFMVLELNQASRTKSAIIDIYKEYFPTENELIDLDIKHFDHQKRNKFIDKLKGEKIIGWLSSLDDKVDLEVCLFPNKKEHDRIIELVKVINNNNTAFEHLNSLDRVEIYPSGQFFKRTREKLQDSPFENYKERIDTCVQDEIKQGRTKEQARHNFLDLRIKLKI